MPAIDTASSTRCHRCSAPATALAAELVIYRKLGQVGAKPDKLDIERKIMGRQITVQ